MKPTDTAVVLGLLLAGLTLFGAAACANTTVGVGWSVPIGGGPYPYGWGVTPTIGVGVYGRPF